MASPIVNADQDIGMVSVGPSDYGCSACCGTAGGVFNARTSVTMIKLLSTSRSF